MELLFQDDAYLKSCDATVTSVDGNMVRLDRTIFYPTGGGQPGDHGTLQVGAATYDIVDTRKGEGHLDVVHILAEDADAPSVGDKGTLTLDWERRHKHMRMHTAMHIVCALIEGDVTGGQVGIEKSRLDFNLAESPDKVELTERLNEVIEAGHDTRTIWITDEEMEAQPDMVRTMSVKPPKGAGRVRLLEIGDGIDLQPCGGTHVQNTAEIGKLVIAKIENKGKQNRRINIKFAD